MFISLTGEAFANLAAAKGAGKPVIAYGVFFNTVTNFLIVAFVIFLLVKQANRLQKPAPVAAPPTKDCPYCLGAVLIKATRCPQCTSQLTA